MEIIPDRKSEKTELRLLSAITKVPKNKLTEIVESTLEEKLRKSGITFEKEVQEHGHDTKIIVSMKKSKCAGLIYTGKMNENRCKNLT